MNLYVELINSTIDYIEENLAKDMSLEEIAKEFCVSEFHFNRMFKTVVGKTLKQYILGRKLTWAVEQLNSTSKPIIDIAYDLGFEYPEVFSRAFSKHFGISPMDCRKNKLKPELIQRAAVVERDIVSYQGVLTLKGNSVKMNQLNLRGIPIEVDENKADFEQSLQQTGERFLTKAQGLGWLNRDRFYTVVNCHGQEDGRYTVFYGMEPLAETEEEGFDARIVPGGWYESFNYTGDMFDIREAFVDDLYRWVMLKEIELNPNGVGMLNIYDKDYFYKGRVQILVPIKK